MKRALFVYSRNRRRSPTAERLRRLAGGRGDVGGARARRRGDRDGGALDGVDLVLVMERVRRARLRRRFGEHLRRTRVVCLDIPDDYEFMDPALVGVLAARAGPHLERLSGAVHRRRGPE